MYSMSSRRMKLSGAVLGLTVLSAGFAPRASVAQASPARAVPLDPATCTVVQPLGTVSLDWNPGFDPESAVTGIDRFGLVFEAAGPDGVTTLRAGSAGANIARSTVVTPLANGIYHFEFRVPLTLSPGTYRVVDAAVAPSLAAGYQGPVPHMTNSPARQRFCITVVRPPASSTAAVSNP